MKTAHTDRFPYLLRLLEVFRDHTSSISQEDAAIESFSADLLNNINNEDRRRLVNAGALEAIVAAMQQVGRSLQSYKTLLILFYAFLSESLIPKHGHSATTTTTKTTQCEFSKGVV